MTIPNVLPSADPTRQVAIRKNTNPTPNINVAKPPTTQRGPTTPGGFTPAPQGPTVSQPGNIGAVNFSPAPSVPQVATPPGVNVTPIVPGQNDLRGQTITSGYDPRLAATQGLVDQTAYNVANPNATLNLYADAISGIKNAPQLTGNYGVNVPGLANAGTYTASAETDAARQAIAAGLTGLNNSPDRGQIAGQYLSLLEQQSQPGYEQALRQVGQKAAALGRIGSGVTTSDLGDVTQRREQALAQARQGLAADAASQNLQDQLARLQAGEGVYGTFSNTDLANAGLKLQGQGLQLNQAQANASQALAADQARAQQALQQSGLLANLGTGLAGLNLSTLGALSGLEGQQYGQQQGNVAQLQGERGYQDQLAQQAQNDAIQQYLLEQQGQAQTFGQNQSQLQNLINLGYLNDPSSIEQYQAANLGNQANSSYNSAIGALGSLGQYLGNRGTSSVAAPGAITPQTANQILQYQQPQRLSYLPYNRP